MSLSLVLFVPMKLIGLWIFADPIGPSRERWQQTVKKDFNLVLKSRTKDVKVS